MYIKYFLNQIEPIPGYSVYKEFIFCSSVCQARKARWLLSHVQYVYTARCVWQPLFAQTLCSLSTQQDVAATFCNKAISRNFSPLLGHMGFHARS